MSQPKFKEKAIRMVLLCVSYVLLTCFTAIAQTRSVMDLPEPQVENALTMTGLNYLGGFVAQERGITNRLTFMYGIGVHYSFFSSDTTPPIFGTRFIEVVDKVFGRSYSTEGLTPYLLFEVRSYNLVRRVLRGKSVKNNTANYIGIMGELPFASGSLINVPNLALAYPIGIKYGMRRALGQHVYAEGSLGGIIKVSSVQSSFQPRLDASLAWCW